MPLQSGPESDSLARRSWLFWLAVVILAADLAYGLWWGAADLAIRFWPASHAWIDPRMIEFVLTVPLWEEAIYALTLVLMSYTLWLVLQRKARVLLVYPLVILLFALDWIGSLFAGSEYLTNQGLASLVLGAGIFLLLYWLRARGDLR